MTTRRQHEEEYRRVRREQDALLEENLGHRLGVYRRVVIFTPLAIAFVVGFALLLLSLLGGNAGATIGAVVLGVITFALGYEALAALRDLPTQPMTSSGPAERVWVKSKFLVFGKTGYLLLNGRVFEIRVDTALLLEAGAPVTVEHWPHTNLLVTLHRDAAGSSMD